jgi:hypothetical protein
MNVKTIRNAFVGMAAVVVTAASQAQIQAPVAFSGTTAVGQQSTARAVTVTMTAGGTSAAPIVVVQGAATPGPAPADFVLSSAGGSGYCVANHNYSIGDQCTVNVVFQPSFPGQRTGAVEVLSQSGTLLGSQLIVGNATGGLPVLIPGNIQTVAGDNTWTYTGDNVAATTSSIFLPQGVVTDGAGNIYLSDTSNNRVRRVDAQTQVITTIAGTGTAGFSGDGGLATSAMVNAPSGMAMDGAGNLYFADSVNNIIRRIDAVSGMITTVAGTPQTHGYSGDGGAATSARLSMPEGVAFDAAGDLIIADTGNNVIRKVNASNGVITTIAGQGRAGYNGDGILATAAYLNQPWGIAYSPSGLLYIADFSNNRVRFVDGAGTIHTAVGSTTAGYTGDGDSATTALLDNPACVAFDPAGDFFICDAANNRVRIVTVGNGQINTVAGNGLGLYGGDGAQSNLASLHGPYAIYLDGAGNLFIADTINMRIREVTADLLAFNYPTMRVGKISSPKLTTLENEGNDSLDVTSYVFNQSALDPATTNCVMNVAELTGTGCTLGVEFAPMFVGQGIVGTLTVNNTAPNTLPVIQVSGDVLSVNPTSMSLTTSGSPSLIGSPVTFTAAVSSSNTALTGTVAFFDGPTQISPNIAISNNGASFTATGLTLGSHNITATYSGDTQDAAATSAVLVQVVKQAATLLLAATPSQATVTNTVTLMLTATAPTGTPTGTITFYDGTTAIGSANLNTGGVATIPVSTLSAGSHSLTGQYPGDASNMAGTSNVFTEVINQATTTTTLATSASPVSVGTTVTFTATVTGSSTDAPTGNVTFTADGTNVLGTSTLNTGGIAPLPTAALTPGTHTIVAAYAGDTNNSASSAVGLVEIVNQIGTTTAITVGPNPANAGALVTLTANVAIAAGATPDGAITGTVTFKDGATTLGTAALNTAGQAVLTLNTLAAGPHAVLATYNGNTNYVGSNSSALAETINSTSTNAALNASSSPVFAGQNETFTVTLTSATGGIPTGAVAFHEGASVIGTGTVNAQGIATFSTTTLAVGTHTVTAAYPGDLNYQPSTSAAVTVVVQLAPTTTALATSANPSVLGQGLTLTATVTSITANPTGNVNFMDGSTLLSSVAVNAGGTAVYSTSSLTFGAHVLTAVYQGDSIHATSTSSAVNEQIVETAAETLTSSANPATSGTNVTFTAVVNGQNGVVPTGQVTFKDGTALLGTMTTTNGVAAYSTNTLAVGTHTIAASYSGDTNYAVASVSITQTITNANTQIELSASANPATYAVPVSLTAVITSNGGVATGIVTFTDGGVTVGTATLDATGKAVLTTSTLAPGPHSIVANYAGDGKASGSVSTPLSLVVKELTQTVVTSSANPSLTLSQVTFTATVTNAGVGVATGNVTFTDGSTTLGTSSVNSSGVATVTVPSLTMGAHSVSVSYSGDGADFASTSAALTETVNLRPTSTSLTGIPTDPANPTEVTLIAVVAGNGTPSPSGTVTFTTGGITMGSATVGTTGVATLTVFLQQSSETITASYNGDISYAVSASAPTAISTGTAPQFVVNVTPGSATLVSKQRVVVTVTVTSLGSFADTMNLGCLGLPYAATCTFSSSGLKLNANGTATAQLTIDTGNPLGAGTQASVHGLTKSSVLECLIPVGLLFGFGLRRRRKLASLLAVLMVAALTLTASGCAGLQVNGTPAGTYHFTVGATGAGTAASQSQTFTLTVTP